MFGNLFKINYTPEDRKKYAERKIREYGAEIKEIEKRKPFDDNWDGGASELYVYTLEEKIKKYKKYLGK